MQSNNNNGPIENLKSRTLSWIIIGAMVCTGALNTSAVPSWLAFRAGSTNPIYGGTTAQTLSSTFGTNSTTLPFSGFSSWQFYSPALTNAVSLTSSDKGGGVVYMRNTGLTSSNDFYVLSEMSYYDYDPKTGTKVLIVAGGISSVETVAHNQTTNWTMPNGTLASNYTIPAGHMIDVALTIVTVWGNPGSYGELVYNGTNGSSTAASLPQTRAAGLNWPFGAPATVSAAARVVSVARQTNGCMCISCSGGAATTYSIQACTNLASGVWTTIATTNSDTNGIFGCMDSGARTNACCFYRTMTISP